MGVDVTKAATRRTALVWAARGLARAAGGLALVAGPLSGGARAAQELYSYSVVHHFSPALDGEHHPRQLYGGVAVARDGAIYGLSQAGGRQDAGVVFRLSPAGTDGRLVHEFGKTALDGRTPSRVLVEEPDGHFIGATSRGGEFGKGVVFRMHPDGFMRPLHHFSQPATFGQYPSGPPVLASNGWRYGLMSGGGEREAGTIYRLGPDGEFELLYAFQGRFRGDGVSPLGPLVEAADGWLYGVTDAGGSNARGVLFRVSLEGRYERLHDFNNGLVGATPAAALMRARDGHLYGATRHGGERGRGAIFRLEPGRRPKPVHAIDGSEGQRVTGPLAEGPDGHLYYMLAWGPLGADRQAPLVRLHPASGAATVVGRLAADQIGTEVYGGPAFGQDGSVYGTTLLPDGGVLFRFTPTGP